MNIYNIDFREPNDLDCNSYLQINDCGMIAFRNKTAGLARSRGRSDYQLIYIESGQFEAEYNGATHHLKQGFVLYPPNTLHKEVFNTKAIKDLCLTADDIWLAAMHLLKGTKKYYTGYKQGHLAVFIKNNLTLLDVNRERNQVCVDNLNNYYQRELDA